MAFDAFVHVRSTSVPIHPPRPARGSLLHALVFSIVGTCAILPTVAHAACKVEGASYSTARADAFLADPTRLLSRGDLALGKIRDAVAQLGENAPAFKLRALGAIVSKANSRQKLAMGQGLLDAFNACTRTNAADAAAIDSVVKNMGSPALLAAYRSASTDFSPTTVEPAGSTFKSNAGARDARLIMLAPGFRGDGSLKLSDPTALPGF